MLRSTTFESHKRETNGIGSLANATFHFFGNHHQDKTQKARINTRTIGSQCNTQSMQSNFDNQHSRTCPTLTPNPCNPTVRVCRAHVHDTPRARHGRRMSKWSVHTFWIATTPCGATFMTRYTSQGPTVGPRQCRISIAKLSWKQILHTSMVRNLNCETVFGAESPL